jgi:outer membrane protein OmpA-like peptidoglycan-associated protein
MKALFLRPQGILILFTIINDSFSCICPSNILKKLAMVRGSLLVTFSALMLLSCVSCGEKMEEVSLPSPAPPEYDLYHALMNNVPLNMASREVPDRFVAEAYAYFETGSADIHETQFVNLPQIVETLAAKPFSTIYIKGFAHDEEKLSEADRQTLSAHRANAVRGYLSERLAGMGIPKTQIFTVEEGESFYSHSCDEYPDPADRNNCIRSAQRAEIKISGTDPRETKTMRYYWNAWADRIASTMANTPSHSSVPYLEPDTEYLIMVDLAGFEYEMPHVKTFAVKRILRETLDREKEQGRTPKLPFQVVLLTDEIFFKTKSHVLPEPFNVNMDRIRKFGPKKYDQSINPLEDFKAGRDPEYRFGSLEIRVKTAENVYGRTAIGLSFWNSSRPYSEISIPFCVRRPEEPPCPTSFQISAGLGTKLGGSGILEASGTAVHDSQCPNAAITIIELSPSTVVGVLFIDNVENRKHYDEQAERTAKDSIDKYKIWTIENESTKKFVEKLKSYQNDFGKIRDVAGTGNALKNLLFPPINKEAVEARDALFAFIQKKRGSRPFESADPPVIFVRVVLEDDQIPRPWLYPIGLISVGSDEELDFLGYHLRIETPLLGQSYNSFSNCLNNWFAVLPIDQTDPPLKNAMNEVDRGGRIDIGREVKNYQPVRGHESALLFEDIQLFRKWIQRCGPFDSCDDRINEPGILTVLSHHNKQSIFFNDKISKVVPDNIVRNLPRPSIAVLSGCSTAEIGASDIIQQLNVTGVDAVIATNTGIQGDMAGDFLECLSRSIESVEAGGSVKVGKLVWRAQRCLYEGEFLKPNDTPRNIYGHRVLSFTFAGNPNVSICGPE